MNDFNIKTKTMMTTKKYYAMAILAMGTLVISSCNSDDDNGSGSLYQGSGAYGKKADISSKDKNLVAGRYYIDSWTSEAPKDWDKDGVYNTNLINEIDPCYLDNPLYIGIALYNRKDEGTLCFGTESEGEKLVEGEYYLNYDKTTDYGKITFKNDEGGTADQMQQLEVFEDAGRKTLIGRVYDQEDETFDIVVYRTCCD